MQIEKWLKCKDKFEVTYIPVAQMETFSPSLWQGVAFAYISQEVLSYKSKWSPFFNDKIVTLSFLFSLGQHNRIVIYFI